MSGNGCVMNNNNFRDDVVECCQLLLSNKCC
jgi:hypothetical protein